jgi:hypothetical protein
MPKRHTNAETPLSITPNLHLCGPAVCVEEVTSRAEMDWSFLGSEWLIAHLLAIM